MLSHRQKVGIIGAGAVGSSTAFSLITQGLCDEVVLIDKNKEKSYAEAMDLMQSIEFLSRNIQIYSGDYEDCSDADIIVITASVPYLPGQTRLDMLPRAAEITQSIVESAMENGFHGIFVIVTNPVDIISNFVYKLSGLSKNQVIGTGTSLDSARLSLFIAQLIGVDPRSVQAFTLGEHGDSQMIPWSRIMIGGKQFIEILSDNQSQFGNIDLSDLAKKTIKAGWEIANRKGTTNYGIASATVSIIKAILHDENRIIPVSARLDGEYGESKIFAGVPAVINRFGVKELVELPLTPEEQESFRKSAHVIRGYTKSLFQE